MRKFRCIPVLLALLSVTACGSSTEDELAEKAEPQEMHVLSNEQELLQQAKGIDALLNKDAAEKKKAIEEETKN